MSAETEEKPKVTLRPREAVAQARKARVAGRGALSLLEWSVQSLVLSLFPGIGLLDRAFEEAGFTVVRGPDKIWGGDVRNFHVPAGVFAGVIGGPPCQVFSIEERAERRMLTTHKLEGMHYAALTEVRRELQLRSRSNDKSSDESAAKTL